MTPLTHVLITRAPVDKAAAALGGSFPVGRYGEWTVVAMPLDINSWPIPPMGELSKGTKEVVLGAMDLGDAVGVAASAKGKMTPLMWSLGWRPPSGAIAERRHWVGWKIAAKELAETAKQRKAAKGLGQLRNPGDGQRESLERLLAGAMQELGIPAELRGVHVGNLGPLTDVVGRWPETL